MAFVMTSYTADAARGGPWGWDDGMMGMVRCRIFLVAAGDRFTIIPAAAIGP